MSVFTEYPYELGDPPRELAPSTRGLDDKRYARLMRLLRRGGRPCEHPTMACWKSTFFDPKVVGGVAVRTTCQDCGKSTREYALDGHMRPVWG